MNELKDRVAVYDKFSKCALKYFKHLWGLHLRKWVYQTWRDIQMSHLYIAHPVIISYSIHVDINQIFDRSNV